MTDCNGLHKGEAATLKNWKGKITGHESDNDKYKFLIGSHTESLNISNFEIAMIKLRQSR